MRARAYQNRHVDRCDGLPPAAPAVKAKAPHVPAPAAPAAPVKAPKPPAPPTPAARNGSYIDDMKNAGYDNLDVDELIAF